MKATPDQPLSSELLAAYLEGVVTADESTRIERALAACPRNRRHLAELRSIRDALTAPTPGVDDLDLVDAVRNKAQLRAIGGQRKRPPAFGALATAMAGIAAVSLGIVVSRRDWANAPDGAGWGRALEPSEFRAKTASSAAAQERWTGIRIHRVVDHQAPEAVTESLDRHDSLLFSYTNRGHDPYEYLMIFAIGADQRVYWFYPAYESVAENPLSIGIGPGHSTLPDAVAHDYGAGALEVYALFSHQPERVSGIEAWLSARARARDDEAGEAVPVPGAILRRVSLRVRP